MKIYNNVKVVDHLTFSALEGQILSILGPNGAGKTTLINMISTIVKPDSGTAKIYGIDLITQRSEIPHIIAVSPQETILYNELTARENLIFFASLYGIDQNRAIELAETILKQMGLEKRYDRVKNFSGGMKRRLSIAISAIADPKILIMDEPTVGLDP
jgi:ABC-2 type transport system ATP-binding protein